MPPENFKKKEGSEINNFVDNKKSEPTGSNLIAHNIWKNYSQMNLKSN